MSVCNRLINVVYIVVVMLRFTQNIPKRPRVYSKE